MAVFTTSQVASTARCSTSRSVPAHVRVRVVQTEAKKIACRAMLMYNVLVLAIQFYKPSGTGAEGSPEAGPLPVLVILALPSLYGSF